MVKQLAEITSIRLFFCMYVTYKTDYLKNLVKKRKKTNVPTPQASQTSNLYLYLFII